MSMNDTDPLAYDIKETSRILGIGRTMIYAEMRAGRLRFVKVGRRTIIRHCDAQAWLDLVAENGPQGEGREG